MGLSYREIWALIHGPMIGGPLLRWSIVLIVIWVLLPWYGEETPESPRSLLLADPSTRQWHELPTSGRHTSR